jgi:hypothetical protein
LRERSGKSARIKEKLSARDKEVMAPTEVVEATKD